MTTPYDEAKAAIAAGTAVARALWVLLSAESDRDGFALKPMPWEGPGEYQHVIFGDGRDGFVKVSGERKGLPTSPHTVKPSAPGETKSVKLYSREGAADPFVYVGSVGTVPGDVDYEGHAKRGFDLHDCEVLAVIEGYAYTFNA